MNDLPSITTSTYGSAGNVIQAFQKRLDTDTICDQYRDHIQSASALGFGKTVLARVQQPPQMSTQTKRIVRVYLVDPDERVPVSQSILYEGKEQATDLTDQELYFGIPVNDVLNNHNATRKTILDKRATEKAGRDVFLDEVKIRDLAMRVVVIAQF